MAGRRASQKRGGAIRHTKRERAGSLFCLNQGRAAGFSLTEMIAVIVIAAILAAVALPRLRAGAFEEVRFHDEAVAMLRYAHRSAVTKQRTVCVGFSGNVITLTYDATYGSASCPGAALRGPDGSEPFVVTAQGAAGFSAAPTSFNFDRVGRPSAAQTLSLNGGFQIVVESETGFVR